MMKVLPALLLIGNLLLLPTFSVAENPQENLQQEKRVNNLLDANQVGVDEDKTQSPTDGSSDNAIFNGIKFFLKFLDNVNYGHIVLGVFLSTGVQIIFWVMNLAKENHISKKQMKQKRLENFYTPLLGHLLVSDELWVEFRDESLFPDGSLKDKEGKEVIEAILKIEEEVNGKERANALLNKWMYVMEGVFRYNNEASERVILRNLGLVRMEDNNKHFRDDYMKFLQHVGEFRSVLNRWKDEREKIPVGGGLFEHSFRWSKELDETKQWEYFHPRNAFPISFRSQVQESTEALRTSGIKRFLIKINPKYFTRPG